MNVVDVDQAAALVGVSPRLIYKWAQTGRLRPVRITTTDRMRFIEDEVVECAVAHRSGRQRRRLDKMTRRWEQQCASVQPV